MTALARALPPSVVFNRPLQLQPMPEWTCEDPETPSCRVAARGFTFDCTSGSLGGVVVDPRVILANVVLTSLSTAATSGCVVFRGDADQLVLRSRPAAPSGPQVLFELRRLSGLSWAQLAEMIDVERRSVHNWAAGKAIALKNLQRIGELLAFVQYMDRGSAHENAALLLGATPFGQTLLQLLAHGDMARARAITTRGPGRVVPSRKAEGETMLGMEHFGQAWQRAQDVQGDGEPGKVLNKPKLRRVTARKALRR